MGVIWAALSAPGRGFVLRHFYGPVFTATVSLERNCTCFFTMKKPRHYFLLLSFPGFNSTVAALTLASKGIIFMLLNFIPLIVFQYSKQSSGASCSFSILMMFHKFQTTPVLAPFFTKICTINMYMHTENHSYFTFFFYTLVLLYCILPAICFWMFLSYLTILVIVVFSHSNMFMAQLILC